MNHRHKVKSEYPVWKEVSAILLIAGVIVTISSLLLDFTGGVRAGCVTALVGANIGLIASWVWSP